jgi:hypothetical protein
MSSKAPNACLPIPAGQPGNRFILRSDLPHFTTDFLETAPKFAARRPGNLCVYEMDNPRKSESRSGGLSMAH